MASRGQWSLVEVGRVTILPLFAPFLNFKWLQTSLNVRPGFRKVGNEGNMCYVTLDGHMNVLRGLQGA